MKLMKKRQKKAHIMEIQINGGMHPGNSGGPVFWTPAARKLPGTVQPDHPFIAGVLTSEVRPSDEPLGIGVVAHASYVREAIALLDAAPAVGQGP